MSLAVSMIFHPRPVTSIENSPCETLSFDFISFCGLCHDLSFISPAGYAKIGAGLSMSAPVINFPLRLIVSRYVKLKINVSLLSFVFEYAGLSQN